MYFQLLPKPDLVSQKKEIFSQYEVLFEILSDANEFDGLVLSLRYFYDPDAISQKLKVFLCLNHQDCDRLNQVSQFFQNHKLFEFYELIPIELPSMSWVNRITEIIKFEDDQNNYYIPFPFIPNLDNDGIDLCNQLCKSTTKVMVEITVETCKNTEVLSIRNALQLISSQLSKVGANNKSKLAVGTYSLYFDTYRNSNLFKYGIKVLTEISNELSIISGLISSSLKSAMQGYCRLPTLEKDSEEFRLNLEATEQAQLYIGASLNRSGLEVGKKMLNSATTNDKLDFSSYSFNKPLNLSGKSLSGGSTRALSGNSGGGISEAGQSSEIAVSNSDKAIASFIHNLPDGSQSKAQFSDLKLLHRLVTPTEISGFFRLPLAIAAPPEKTRMTVEELLAKYADLTIKFTETIDCDRLKTYSEIINAFGKCKSAGEKIYLFDALAQNDKPPVDALMYILEKSRLEELLALTIQVFSKTTNADIKEKSRSSRSLFAMLSHHAQKGQTDLIRWSAARTIKNIEFNYEFIGESFKDDPQTIADMIICSKLKILDDQNLLTSEGFKKYLNFWIYGGEDALKQAKELTD